MNADFIDMLDGYKAENDELLQNMEDALMEIQENGMDDETINAVFRAAHTIKGSSGMFGIGYIVEFTHIAENLLDKIRNHKVEINDEIIELLLSCKDHMQILVDFVMNDPESELDENIQSDSQALINELQKYLSPEISSEPEEPKKEIIEKTQEDNDDEVQNIYNVEAKFKSDTFSKGFDTNSFIEYLQEVGEIIEISTDFDAIASYDELDPLKCYLFYTIKLKSSKKKKKIKKVFDYIKDSVDLSIEKMEKEGLVQEVIEVKVDDNVVEVEEKDIVEVIPAKVEPKKDVEVEVKPKNIVKKPKQTSSIRIEASKVDSLINLVGEMVIANASVMQKVSDEKNASLIESVAVVSRMLEELRENAMQIRMIPIGETFNKFKRIVHDTANKIGKKVDLVIKGGDTELDKTVIEKISDPLVHLIRNSIDHGIETPEVRDELGKVVTGTLELNAYHDAGFIAIEIVDDGKGLDTEVLLAKGIEKGLVSEDDELSEQEIFELILQAGFSTAKEVTDISGRGVGMDVVKRNINELHGTIEIDSKKSKGTKITIKLPLTLAIIDGFLTKVGDTNIIIPLDMLVECIELSSHTKEQMHNNSYINLRGSVLPLLNISTYFDIDSSNKSRTNVIVTQYGGQKMGIIVDELLGELQTVIKPMGRLFKNLNYFSGSTILGSGEVALIMDIPVMLSKMEHKQKEHTAQ